MGMTLRLSSLLWLALGGLWIGCGDDSGGGDGPGGGGADEGGGAAGDGDGDGASGSGGDDAFGNADPDEALPDADALMMPMPNPDAFWEDDPPPMMCLEDGSSGPPAVAPGGTPECPDDKNREGCPCDEVGERAECWPGLRANRNRGICRDGATTCEPFGEFGGAWGECIGYILPIEGEVTGSAACRCFAQGSWLLDNLRPCFITYTDDSIYAVSTLIGDDGVSSCPANAGGPPPIPAPGNWSPNRVAVDCAGRFELCYTIKAGDAESPQDSDCVIASVCVEDWYEEAGVEQEFPVLPAWTSNDAACARQFVDSGGYGEMTVKGLSVECDPIDDGNNQPYVFNRVNYCPLSCNDNPDAPECANCGQGGSGNF